jgi:hypothetical protein
MKLPFLKCGRWAEPEPNVRESKISRKWQDLPGVILPEGQPNDHDHFRLDA